jgi:hypothetical protein
MMLGVGVGVGFCGTIIDSPTKKSGPDTDSDTEMLSCFVDTKQLCVLLFE